MGNSSSSSSSLPVNVIVTAPFRCQMVAEKEIFRKNIIVSAAHDMFELYMPKGWTMFLYTDTTYTTYEMHSSYKQYRRQSKYRKDLTSSFSRHQKDTAHTWVIDINTNDVTAFDCSLYFPPISQTLCEQLVLELSLNNVATAFNLCRVTDDVVVEAAEIGYSKVFRIEFSEYITEDRVALIVKNICCWMKKVQDA